MRMLVCAARPMSAAERIDCRRLHHSRRLLDHDRPFVHDELCERPDGDLPLVDEDGGGQPAACAAQRADGIAAPPGRTRMCTRQISGSGRSDPCNRGTKSPFHRQDIRRQIAPSRSLPLRRVISMGHPRLRTRRHKGGEPRHRSIGDLSAEATRTCTRRFRRIVVHRSSRGRAARAATAPGVCENSFKSLLLSSGGRFDSRTCRLC